MTDQAPLFQSPDAGKDVSQHSPSQTQGDSPRETQPDDSTSRFQEWKDKERAEFEAWKARRNQPEPAQHGQFDDKPADSKKVETGRSVPTEATKSEAVADTPKEDEKPQSYVWLPNGEIRLVNNEDLPGHAGIEAQNGLWEEDGKVYTIVAVYPKEFTKESK